MLYTILVKRVLYGNRNKTVWKAVEKKIQLSFVPFARLGLRLIPDWDPMIVEYVYVEQFSPGPAKEEIEVWVEACVEEDEEKMGETLNDHLEAGWVEGE